MLIYEAKVFSESCVAVCCSVLQCVAVCCSVLQCVAVCCSVLQHIIMLIYEAKVFPLPFSFFHYDQTINESSGGMGVGGASYA